jgi:large subunit ribosomal protein L38e
MRKLEMPEELKSREEFMTTLGLASICYVKRVKNSEIVKLKLRTKKRLYTYKTTPLEADDIVQNLNIPVEEV